MSIFKVGAGFVNRVFAELCSSSPTRYRLVLYGEVNRPTTLTANYTNLGELPTSLGYTNTGNASTTGIPLTPILNSGSLSFEDVVITSSVGETIGPVYVCLVIDTEANNTVIYNMNISDYPKQCSNGGSATISFPGNLITITS